ncbi:glycosyltransferase family 4 protein [Lentibacillus salicampi]|uniref:Glycosyltransferase n=1 Tax=Lentibacillus salicampi TaxID=175306 RepID=A0A4Y9AAW3_9BACI|nr:glycosyltransferase family 4 protein [Lentibacillus salicampi]TFJ93048.1 glycosyltransferase [Lentibacillus salicampi]
MGKVAMYSTSRLFGERITGGLKRFLELYKGLKIRGTDVDLYSADSSRSLEENGVVSGYSLMFKGKSKNTFVPTVFNIIIRNLGTLWKIKKAKYDSIIVFDVPAAIGLCLLGIKNIQLFIRQDLVGYKNIAISSRTNSKLFKNIYLQFMKICEAICLLVAERVVIQCEYDYNVIINRHRFIKNKISKKSIIQINNVNPSWIVDNSITDKSFIENDQNKKFTIGFIGDFSNDRKGHRILVDAAKRLIDRGVDIDIILIGEGKQLSAYKEGCANYPNIKFTGRLDNPIEVVKQCNLMVVPSLADSCPNTVMEGLYNEVPVIGARSGGIPEVLNNEDFLFDPNPSSLESKIEYFLNRDNLTKLRKKQYTRKRELEFDWNAIIIGHLQLESK